LIAIDASALVAIVLKEAEASLLAKTIATSATCVAAPTVLEAHMVVTHRVPDHGAALLRELLADQEIETVSFTKEMADIARAAFDQYGKGRHPASLNFGDCMSYALAKARDLPLLYKGNDFSQTDIRPAWRP
jgi:ribonuclease VapC